MTNPGFKHLEQYRDVESLNMFAELKTDGRNTEELLRILARKSRDNSRTPMQWTAGEQAGFTTGTPWISVSHNAQSINAELALADNDSVFYLYQQLIRLRKSLPVLTDGDYEDLLPEHPQLWCYTRTANGKTLSVMANLSAQEQTLALPVFCGEQVLSNYATPAVCDVLRPYECRWQLAG